MTTTKKNSDVKIGQVGFGAVGNYPPTNWKFTGVRNGSCVLEHVKHPSQSTGYGEQFVGWDDVHRIMGS
jgi:hypothetical protein